MRKNKATRKSKSKSKSRSNRKSGAGYLSPAEFFNPNARQPSSVEAAVSSQPNAGWVRPPMSASPALSPNAKMGGSRKNRASMKGGFAPAIMGSFVSNVNAVVAPLVLAGLYKIFGTRKVAKVAKSAKKL